MARKDLSDAYPAGVQIVDFAATTGNYYHTFTIPNSFADFGYQIDIAGYAQNMGGATHMLYAQVNGINSGYIGGYRRMYNSANAVPTQDSFAGVTWGYSLGILGDYSANGHFNATANFGGLPRAVYGTRYFPCRSTCVFSPVGNAYVLTSDCGSVHTATANDIAWATLRVGIARGSDGASVGYFQHTRIVLTPLGA